MNDSSSRFQHLFIVRLWSEESQASPAKWRGSVEHIQSGRKFYFTSLGDLNDFISFRLEKEQKTNTGGQPTNIRR